MLRLAVGCCYSSVTLYDNEANTSTEFGLTCEYIRERKKRGKASRKDIAQQQAAAAGKGSQPSEDSTAGSPSSQDKSVEPARNSSPMLPEGQRPLPDLPGRSASMTITRELDPTPTYQSRTMSMSAVNRLPEHDLHHHMDDGMHTMQPMQPPRIQTQGLALHNPIPEYTSMDDFHRNLTYPSPHQMMQNGMHPVVPSHGLEYSDSPYSMMSPQSAHTQVPANPYRLPEEPANLNYISQSPVAGSPGWMLPSPSTTMYSGAPQPNPSQQLRYPVLEPLVPHLANIMPVSLACDLLELYFQSSSSAFMQPVSPYVLGYVFRKRSFLRAHNPRMCNPALLASMLWIGCLTSESPYLSSSPSARSQLSEKLINLTISLLKPLVHQTPGGSDPSPTIFTSSGVINGVTMGGFGMPAQDSEICLRKSTVLSCDGYCKLTHRLLAGAPGGLDDVATYMHLAIVISASEYKAASLRWWNAAWSLARELKLGKEVPVTPPPEPNDDDDDDAQGELDMQHMGDPHPNGPSTPVDFTEEQREERRRIWWLLYTVDR
jgi:hypothetical protein